MSDTFCIVPWKHLSIHPDGAAHMCCRATGPLTAADGTALSVYGGSLDAIWNSDCLREVRRAMLEGEKVPLCECCYQQEAAGNLSDRIDWNKRWQDGSLNEENWDLDELRAHSIANSYRNLAPSHFELFVGNQCNLKCRMCGAGASTRIARDPVHSQWSPPAGWTCHPSDGTGSRTTRLPASCCATRTSSGPCTSWAASR